MNGFLYIDYSMKQYLYDCILISYLTKGGFNKGELDKLSFEDFKHVKEESIKFNKEIYK